MVYHQSMNDSSANPKKVRAYRIIACIVFLILTFVFIMVSRTIYQTNNIGFNVHFPTGIITQVFITHPDGDQLTIRDRIILINDKPVSLINSNELNSSSDAIKIEFVSPTDVVRTIYVHGIRNNLIIALEILALPILGLLLFVPGFLLVFLRPPRVTEMHFLMFGFFCGIYWILGPILPSANKGLLIANYLSLVFAGWSFIEFHWRYLAVSPSTRIKNGFRFLQGLVVFVFIYGVIQHYPDAFWKTTLDTVLILDLFLSFVIIFVIFTTQLIKKEFSIGTLRTLFLTSIVGTMPSVVFYLLPITLRYSAFLPVIIVTIPIAIVPVNYFLLMMNRKEWINASVIILSSTATVFVAQIFVILAEKFLPGGLPDYRATGNWMDFLVSVFVLTSLFLLYKGMNSLFTRIIYGNVIGSSNKLYQAGYSVVEHDVDERPVIQMAQIFIREFFRYDYINICLVDGTMIQFDSHLQIKALQLDEERMKQLVHELGNDQLFRRSDGFMGRTVNHLELSTMQSQFPQVFGQDPHYCYILLGAKGRVGFIAAGKRKRNETFDHRENQQVILLLSQFEVILENLLLLEQIERTNLQVRMSGQKMLQMRENERKRIARDMHDNIIQAITAFRYQLNELYDSDKLSISDEESDELQHNLLNITQDIRDICFDLRPPALDATGLQSAVVSLVESYHQRGDLFINVEVQGEEIVNAIAEDVAICLYRVLQESLLNIYKHADTRLARVSLTGKEDSIIMEVEDAGRGFEVPDRINELVVDGHFGLMGAQEFLDTVNGVFSVESVPGKGATITAVIPLIREVGENGVFYDYRR